jgi:hypothetical protein
MTEPADSLGEALPREMARVREMLVDYTKMTGDHPALARGMGPLMFMMRRALDEAARVMAEGDVVGMVRCHQELKGFEP